MTAATPTGPGFDVILLLHVAAIVVSLAAVVVSGVQAARLLALKAPRRAPDGGRPAALPGTGPGVPGAPGVASVPDVSPTLRAYYRPGINWLGRVSYLVPALGFTLVAMSQGAYDLGDAWVLWGLGLWLFSAFGAEGLVWPAERRLQRVLGTEVRGPGLATEGEAVRRAARTICLVSTTIVVAFVAAIVLMVAKPR